MPAPALPDFTPPSSHLGHHHPNGIDRNSPRLSMRVSPEELYASGLAASPPPVKPASRHNSVSRSSSRSVRKSLAKSEWTPDALWNKNSSMCALAISRVSNTNHNSFDAAERISFSPPSSPTKLFKRKKRQDAEREPVKQWSAYKVSFTSAAELPAKIKPGEVLVHVLATALDFWDQARVRELGRRSDGLGFVPGRSFYGKVLQVGADCKLHAGQFVYGICSVAKVSFLIFLLCDTADSGRFKSGTLAELMIVDKSSVCLAPTCNPGLTTEQLAALPITGIPAMATVWPLANSLPRGARVRYFYLS